MVVSTYGSDRFRLLTSGIDGHQDRPCEDCPNDANKSHDLEQPQEEVVVEGRVIEHVSVIQCPEVFDPSEATGRRSRRLLTAQVVSRRNEGKTVSSLLVIEKRNVCTWFVHTAEFGPEDEKDAENCARNEPNWNQCRQERRRRRRPVSGTACTTGRHCDCAEALLCAINRVINSNFR